MVVPTIPRVKLWRDALEALRIPIGGLARNRSTQEKYIYQPPAAGPGGHAPRRLERLYILNNTGEPVERATAKLRERLTLSGALGLVASPAVATALGTASAMVETSLKLLKDLRIYDLTYYLDYANMGPTVDAVEEALLK
jgi:hypothetical protein